MQTPGLLFSAMTKKRRIALNIANLPELEAAAVLVERPRPRRELDR
jgi:hypothetical protein